MINEINYHEFNGLHQQNRGIGIQYIFKYKIVTRGKEWYYIMIKGVKTLIKEIKAE